MTISSLRLVSIVSAALLVGCASTRTEVARADPAAEAAVGDLAGTWEGTLVATTTDEHGAPVTFPVTLRLVIESDAARVFTKDPTSQEWLALEPSDRVVFDARGSNAVIYANRAGKIPGPDGSRWFEIYLVAATLKSRDQMLVHWMRMVTNVDTPVDDPDRAGTSAGDGLLDRK